MQISFFSVFYYIFYFLCACVSAFVCACFSWRERISHRRVLLLPVGPVGLIQVVRHLTHSHFPILLFPLFKDKNEGCGMWLSAQEQVLFLQRTQCGSQQLSQAAVYDASFGASDVDAPNTCCTCIHAGQTPV